MAIDTRTQFLLQLLQKLGAPLMQAVGTVPAAANAPPAPGAEDKEAGILAGLLSESVKISISLSQAMNLKPDEGNADAIRVALASLAGGLVADFYRQNGRSPAENDSRRIAKALESVIAFADNFAPAAEHAQRLATLEEAAPFFDASQTALYTIHALTPAIAATQEFSFGQQDTRLIQDVAQRLGDQAKALKDRLGAGGNQMSELILLQTMAQLYAAAHRAETARIKVAGAEAQGAASIDGVWTVFDKQVAMVEVMIGAMLGGGKAGASQGGGGVKPKAEAEPPVAEAPQTPPPLPAASAAAQPATPPPAAPPAAGGNPMSFFKKK